MSNYRSVTAQTIHYLSRPHVGIPAYPLRTPSAWKGPAQEISKDWEWHLTDEQKHEIHKMLLHIKEKGLPLKHLTQADCPLPTLTDAIQTWRHEIIYGRGFVLIRGVPVEKYSAEECETIFWCIGLHLGIPGAQNSAGDLLTHVLDEGKKDDIARLYKTSSAIAYHCDAADMVGLLCINNAKHGGKSRIASSVTVFNEFKKLYPKETYLLFDTVLMDARGENGLDYVAIPPLRFDGKKLRTFYHSDYFRSAKRFPKALVSIKKYETALDKYEAIASNPEIYLEMELLPGDMQFISNHTIIHARTEYKDDSSNDKRHLLRLWLSFAEKESFSYKLLRLKARILLLKSFVGAKFRLY